MIEKDSKLRGAAYRLRDYLAQLPASFDKNHVLSYVFKWITANIENLSLPPYSNQIEHAEYLFRKYSEARADYANDPEPDESEEDLEKMRWPFMEALLTLDNLMGDFKQKRGQPMIDENAENLIHLKIYEHINRWISKLKSYEIEVMINGTNVVIQN